MMNNVLITGVSGFIGMHLMHELLSKYPKVTVTAFTLDDFNFPLYYSFGGFCPLSRINWVRGDLRNLSAVKRVIAEHYIDTVFHLGAQALVGVGYRDPLYTLETNVQGTWNILESCRTVPGVRKIIIASSDKAYGDSTKLPYEEDMALLGRFPYEASKSCADLVSSMYRKSFGLPVMVARCGNTFGEGDVNFSRIIPDTILSTLRGETVTLRNNPGLIRDYIYVKDVVSGYLALTQSNTYSDYNFGYGRGYTTEEIVFTILKLMGKEQSYFIKDRVGGVEEEITAQWLDTSKAKLVLNWMPDYTVDNSLTRTINWYRNYYHEEMQK